MTKSDHKALLSISHPSFGDFPIGYLQTYSDIDEVAEEIVKLGEVYPGPGKPVAPIGAVYLIRYFNGCERELFVIGNSSTITTNSAVFLEKGRKGLYIGEVLKLRIVSERVPESLINALCNL